MALRCAQFEEARYSGDITGDLFQQQRYFADAEQFWRLQNAAIATAKDELTAKDWQAVHVLSPDQPFYAHQWTTAQQEVPSLCVPGI